MDDWKYIAEYENTYRVYSCGVIVNGKGKPLIPIRYKSGYTCVDLCKNGRIKRMLIHRIVAGAFINNPDKKPQVNHINGNKADNRVENLEWATRSENQRHKYRTLHYNHIGENNTQCKLSADDVKKIVYLRSQGMQSRRIARMFNISISTISDIMAGRSWNHITNFPPQRHIERRAQLNSPGGNRRQILHL